MIGRVLGLAGLAVVTFGTGAVQAQTAPANPYDTALRVFAAGAVELRGVMEKCPIDKSKMDDWDMATGRLVASLWASGMAAETVRNVESELEREMASVDCTLDVFATSSIDRVKEGGWTAEVDRVIQLLGLTRVEAPVTPGQWAEIKAVFVEERAAEARLLECMTALDPLQVPAIVADWNDTVQRAQAMLIGAGVPGDEVMAEIAASDPGLIWALPESPQARLALRPQCIADEDWQGRYYEFRHGRLRYETENILAGQP